MRIDIFRNKEIPEGENPYERDIDSIKVYNYIKSQIELNLPLEIWRIIDKIFSEIWNSKIGIGGYFYWDEIENDVLFEFKKLRIMIPDNDIKMIVHTILEYIEQNGGFIE